MKNSITSKRLLEALNDKNMNQAELSRRSGVSESSLSHYINGSHKPSNLAAGSIAEILDVSPVWLMGFDVPKFLPTEEQEKNNKEILFLVNNICKSSKNKNINKLLALINEMTEEQIEMLYGMAKVIKPE